MTPAAGAFFDAYAFGDAPFVVGRVPLLPASVARDVLDADDAGLADLLRASRALRNAIRVASPSIAAAMDDWLAGGVPKNPALVNRIAAYALRAATRATPFALFAGVGAVRVGDVTDLALDAGGRRAVTRPDMAWVADVVREMERNRASYRDVLLSANELILDRGARLHVMNPERTRGRADASRGGTEFTPISLRKTDGVAWVRDAARDGIRFHALVAALDAAFGLGAERAGAFVSKLIEAGVVLPAIDRALLEDPTAYVAATLDRLAPDVAPDARAAFEALAALDARPLDERDAASEDEIAARLGRIYPAPERGLFQVDSAVAFRGTIGAALLEDVATLGALLLRGARTSSLKRYRERFAQRYEGTDRLVPLIELCDPDFGLGAPEALEPVRDDASVARDLMLHDLVLRAHLERSLEVELDDAALDALTTWPDADAFLPDLEIGFQIAARSTAAIAAGEYRVATTTLAATQGAGKSAGRFLHLVGDDGADRLRTLLRGTSNDDELVAELVYFPTRSRNANVAVRPRVRDVELHVGIRGSGDRLTIEDILVGIEGDRFVLYSARHDKRIRVVETHALNTPGTAPALFRFLSSVALDGYRSPGRFDWGALDTAPFLPRLRYGRVVAALARWVVPRAVATDAERFGAWRARWRIPRVVNCVVNLDNKILVDLDTPRGRAVFADQIDERVEHVVLEEPFPAADETWLRGDGGTYVCELVASAVCRRRPAARRRGRIRAYARSDRLQPPGETWVYADIACGRNAQDALLRGRVAPLLAELRAQPGFERWFFARYVEHRDVLRVRMRFAADVADARRRTIEAALAGWVEEGDIDEFSFATYVRELERYGGVAGTDLAEQAFHVDSEIALALLQSTYAGDRARDEAALLGAFELVRGTGARALAWTSAWSPQREKLSDDERAILKAVRPLAIADPLQPAPSQLVSQLLALADRAQLERPVHDVVSSLLHMHFNRLGIEPSAERRFRAMLRQLVVGIVKPKQAAAAVPEGAVI